MVVLVKINLWIWKRSYVTLGNMYNEGNLEEGKGRDETHQGSLVVCLREDKSKGLHISNLGCGGVPNLYARVSLDLVSGSAWFKPQGS